MHLALNPSLYGTIACRRYAFPIIVGCELIALYRADIADLRRTPVIRSIVKTREDPACHYLTESPPVPHLSQPAVILAGGSRYVLAEPP